MSAALIQLSLLAILSLTAAVYDVAVRRIPNWLCVIAAIGGLIFAAILGWQAMLSHAAHMVIALLVGMVLFRFKVVGGGDAKFYAGLAAWFPLASAASLAVTISMAGLVLFLLWAGLRMATGARVRGTGDKPLEKFPYALAIGTGAVLMSAAATGWSLGLG